MPFRRRPRRQEEHHRLNISSKGKWPANVLSNFAAMPFVVDGVQCNSAEGFIQALKFPNPDAEARLLTRGGSR